MVVGRYRVGVGPLWPACIYLRGHSSSNNPLPPSPFLDPSVPVSVSRSSSVWLLTHTHTHADTDQNAQNSRIDHSSVLFPALTLSSSAQSFSFSHLAFPPASSLFLSCVIWKEYIQWNNWECPSFCSCLNNAIAGFIGDHYSNCSIIASTLALAAAHSLSTSRPCHRLCVAQQRVTLDQELWGSLSLSLWPSWQSYSIPLLQRKHISFPLCLYMYTFFVFFYYVFLSHLFFLLFNPCLFLFFSFSSRLALFLSCVGS